MNVPADNQEHAKPAGEDFLVVGRRIRIPRSEFRFTFMRSSGPGGQNVNKVNTKVRLHWKILDSLSLPEEVKERLLTKYRRRITAEGEFLVTSQRFRDQSRNVEDCLEKLREILGSVAVAPRLRKKTRPSRAARERRLRQKREQSDRKRLRRKPARDQ